MLLTLLVVWAGVLYTFFSWVAGIIEGLAGQASSGRDSPWLFAAGIATTLATLISVENIIRNILDKRPSRMRACTLRILLLVPIYAIDSYCGLKYGHSAYHWSYLLTAFREVYESVVLVSFVQFLLAFLGDAQRPGPVSLAAKLSGDQVEHPWILKSVLPTMAPGSDFVSLMIIGILQYAVVMLLVLVSNLAIWLWSVADPAHSSYQAVVEQFPSFIKAASNAVAMYCLVMFYHELMHSQATKEEMNSIRPLTKILCIKGIVLLTFWQTAIITGLANIGVLPGVSDKVSMDQTSQWTTKEVADAILNCLLCLEMLGFAEWHRIAFPPNEFATKPEDDSSNCWLRLTGPTSDSSPPELSDVALSVIGDPNKFLPMYELFEQMWALRRVATAQRRAAKRLRRSKNSSDEELLAAFQAFDLDDDHRVSKSQILFLMVVGERVDAQLAEEGLKSVETAKTETLSFDEFAILVRTTQRLGSATLRQPLLEGSS